MARKAQLKHDYAALEEQANSSLIDTYSLWHATRLSGVDFDRLVLPDLTSEEPFWA